jgi:hypothetical protein
MHVNDRIRSDLARRASKVGGRLRAILGQLMEQLIRWERRLDFWPTFNGTFAA